MRTTELDFTTLNYFRLEIRHLFRSIFREKKKMSHKWQIMNCVGIYNIWIGSLVKCALFNCSCLSFYGYLTTWLDMDTFYISCTIHLVESLKILYSVGQQRRHTNIHDEAKKRYQISWRILNILVQWILKLNCSNGNKNFICKMKSKMHTADFVGDFHFNNSTHISN